MASLLLTLLFWFGIWVVQTGETGFLFAQTRDHQRAARLDRQIAVADAALAANSRRRPATTMAAAATTVAATEPDEGGGLFHLFGGGRRTTRAQLEETAARLRRERADFSPTRFDTTHTVLAAVVAPLPKTSGTIEVLSRQLVRLADVPPPPSTDDEDAAVFDAGDGSTGGGGGRGGRQPGGFRVARDDQERAGHEVEADLRQRSAGYILGTSCAFEAVVLALACWLFARRDY